MLEWWPCLQKKWLFSIWLSRSFEAWSEAAKRTCSAPNSSPWNMVIQWSFNEASFLYVCWSDVGHHGHRSQGSSRWKTEPPTHWVLVQVSDLFQHDLLDSSQGSHGSRSLKALPVWSSVLIDFVWIHAVWSPGSGNVCAGNTTDLRPKEPPKTMEVWFRLRFLQEMSRRLFPWSDPTSHAETLVQRTAWPGGVLLGWEAYECQVKIFEKLVTHS